MRRGLLLCVFLLIGCAPTFKPVPAHLKIPPITEVPPVANKEGVVEVIDGLEVHWVPTASTWTYTEASIPFGRLDDSKHGLNPGTSEYAFLYLHGCHEPANPCRTDHFFPKVERRFGTAISVASTRGRTCRIRVTSPAWRSPWRGTASRRRSGPSRSRRGGVGPPRHGPE